jgi:hypothetical protein
MRPVLRALAVVALAAGTWPTMVAATDEPTGEERLPTPYSADEIRAEWVEGFTVEMLRTVPDGEVHERWTVVAADDGGVDIRFNALDADDQPAGEGVVRHSGWEELRDHASFPADRAERERSTRETPLGDLDGWLYTVHDPEAGSVTRFFFADSLPGAPVWMQVSADGEPQMTLEQVKRSRPED